MDFSWNKEQLDRRRATVEFAERELNNDLVDRNRAGVFDADGWQKCADFGIFGLPVPKKYGGSNADLLTTMLILEGLGYGCRDNGLPFAINSLLWSVQADLLTFGTEAQKQKYVPGTVNGSLVGAFAITEPEMGSDAYALQSSAEKTDDGYILNGHKKYITFGPICDFAIIFANLNREKLKQWGISAFIVDTGTKGFTRGPVDEKIGLRSVPFGDLILEDCFVPEENRLGPEGAGASMFAHAMEWERAFVLVSQLGRMERQLKDCVAYARERQSFGKPIGKNQSVSNRIADMKVRLETARLLLYQAAWLKQEGKSNVMEAAMANLYLSECFTESSLDAIRIHGGRGILSEMEVERDLRDSVPGLIYSGTSDMQRNVIASLLGL
ncbi:MAG: acyl-CoA dehydrogenase family protein [Anaerolineae bacterium]|nr:acyl-CoA dehydrogenase family protein [Anaerolineae bacterium]